jgi:hypothetical protein
MMAGLGATEHVIRAASSLCAGTKKSARGSGRLELDREVSFSVEGLRPCELYSVVLCSSTPYGRRLCCVRMQRERMNQRSLAENLLLIDSFYVIYSVGLPTEYYIYLYVLSPPHTHPKKSPIAVDKPIEMRIAETRSLLGNILINGLFWFFFLKMRI